MFGFAAALLLAAAPAQPADTWKGVLCAHDPARGGLIQSDIYYSYGAAKVWTIGPNALTPVDPTKIAQAKGKSFYTNNDPVIIGGLTYKKYGLPRVLSAAELDPKAHGGKDGATFYHEVGLPKGAKVEVVYLLTQAVGCEFQPYALAD